MLPILVQRKWCPLHWGNSCRRKGCIQCLIFHTPTGSDKVVVGHTGIQLQAPIHKSSVKMTRPWVAIHQPNSDCNWCFGCLNAMKFCLPKPGHSLWFSAPSIVGESLPVTVCNRSGRLDAAPLGAVTEPLFSHGIVFDASADRRQTFQQTP